MVLYLHPLVEQTGFPKRDINRALQLFALEKYAPWVSQLRSENKARALKGFVRWNWERCTLAKDGKRSLEAAHQAIADIGLERVTVQQIWHIVWGIRGKKSHAKQSRSVAKVAVEAFLNAVEGTEEKAPARPEDLARWLDALLETSPRAADLLGAAFVRLDQRRTRAIKAA
jgi:hypothetical protein